MPGFKPFFDTAGNPQIAGAFGVQRGAAVTAGGSSTTGLAISMSGLGDGPGSGSTTGAGLGIYFGSGTPTFGAVTGSLYINQIPVTGAGVATNSRLFVATTHNGTWTGVTTLA